MSAIVIYLIVTVVLLAVLLITMPQVSTANSNSQLNDINYPDNSSSKAVPIAFGTVWGYGNIMFYTKPKHRVIQACQ